MSGVHLFRGDRELAWCGAIGSPAPWRFQPDGSADVWLCEWHHILLVEDLLNGKPAGKE